MTLKTLTHTNNRPVIVEVVNVAENDGYDPIAVYVENKHKEQVESSKRLMKIIDNLYSEDVINEIEK